MGSGDLADGDSGDLGSRIDDSAAATPSELARTADAHWLAAALADSRAQTLATFAALQQALAATGRAIPALAQFNPPLWELGHIGWFQSHWTSRNPQHGRGWDADPDAPRMPAPHAPSGADADALYDSSNVPHATRFGLPLPDADGTRADLAAQLDRTLAMLNHAPHDDRALYFHRLVLLHEDMHHEAALYMADALDLALPGDALRLTALPPPGPALRFGPTRWRLGSSGGGFAFDNEWPAHAVDLGAFAIDAQAVRWAEFMPFIETGGYDDPRFWSAAGRDWLGSQVRAAGAERLPAALRKDGDGRWQMRDRSRWQALDASLPACHLTHFEAEAWCAWAGRRLPTEAEWECAALSSAPTAFRWGDLWEWTATPFVPYPGFIAHPYRDYSAPWFGSRPVLKGASFATSPRLRHPRYRNYFTPERCDIHAGFRSCAPDREAPARAR